MNNLFDIFFTWNFLLLSLSISAIIFVIRTIIESKWNLKENNLWNNVIIPISPILIGLLFGIIAIGFPYPVEIVKISGRICFGLVAGLFSGYTFRIMKSLLLSKLQNKEE